MCKRRFTLVLWQYGSRCTLELIIFKMYGQLLKCIGTAGVYGGPHIPSEVQRSAGGQRASVTGTVPASELRAARLPHLVMLSTV